MGVCGQVRACARVQEQLRGRGGGRRARQAMGKAPHCVFIVSSAWAEGLPMPPLPDAHHPTSMHSTWSARDAACSAVYPQACTASTPPGGAPALSHCCRAACSPASTAGGAQLSLAHLNCAGRGWSGGWRAQRASGQGLASRIPPGALRDWQGAPITLTSRCCFRSVETRGQALVLPHGLFAASSCSACDRCTTNCALFEVLSTAQRAASAP